MRDLPDAMALATLAVVGEGDEPLRSRCLAIAHRESEAGDAAFAAIRRELAARYGTGEDRALLERLAAEIRSGGFDAPASARDWARAVLARITAQKLRESNPEFLAAGGFGALAE